MKRTQHWPIWAIVVPLACLAFSSAFAQIASPTLIPFQGRLTNQDNVPYTGGQYTVTFNLYREAVGGTSLWTERHEKVGVINGMVNVFLGSITAFPAEDSGQPFFATVKHLGITIDADSNTATADPEMVPRQMIIPAFYAKNADNAQALQSHGWNVLFDSEDPLSGKIDANKLADGTIGGSKLSGGAVTFEKLASRPSTGSVAGLGQIAVSSAVSVTVGDDANTQFNLPGLEVTITTSGTRPVIIALQSGGTDGPSQLRYNPDTGNSNEYSVEFQRNADPVFAKMSWRSDTPEGVARGPSLMPPSTYWAIDFPDAGTHVYRVLVEYESPSDTFQVDRVRLA